MTFQRPTLTEIDARVRADIEANMDAVPIVRRGSVLAGLARGVAGASHMAHGFLQWIFRQIFPDTADRPQLERQAGFYGLTRFEPHASSGFADITGQDSAVIHAGTALGHESGLEFVTTEAAVITDGTARVAISAAATGAAGNLQDGERLVILSTVEGIDSDTSVALPGLAGGADEEDDGRLLQRYLLRLRQPPHGGALHDYTQWALDVPGITRVWPVSQSIGTVAVRVVVDDAPHGPVPTAAEIAAVQDYIDSRRPVTADVTVLAPVLVPVDVTLSVTPDTPVVRAEVVTSLEQLLRREAAPGEIIYLTHIAEAISLAIGEVDHQLTTPVADIQPAPGEMAVLGAVVFQ